MIMLLTDSDAEDAVMAQKLRQLSLLVTLTLPISHGLACAKARGRPHTLDNMLMLPPWRGYRPFHARLGWSAHCGPHAMRGRDARRIGGRPRRMAAGWR